MKPTGYRLSHADDATETTRAFALGPSPTPEAAVELLRTILI